MPNWCHNELQVRGSIEDLAAFAEKTKGKDEDGKEEPLLFASLVPEPSQDIKPLPHPVPEGVYDWWTWRREHWGTKWDLCDVDHWTEADGMELWYRFDTAWAPPVAWLEAVSKQFPKLRFALRYAEPGMAFKGYAQAHAEVGLWLDHSEPYEPNPGEAC